MEPTPTTTPNPAPVAAPANPQDGTGTPAAPVAPAVRNAPDFSNTPPATPAPAVPEGYVPTDKFNASRDEAVRLNDLVKSLGYDPKTGQKLAPSTPPATGTPATGLTYEQAVAQVPGFSALSEAEKAMVLNPRQAHKSLTEVQRMVAEMYDTQQTAIQIKDLTSKDAYKDIDPDGFKEFIYRPEHLGVQNLETLAKMYKIELAEKAAATPPTPPKPEGAEPTAGGSKHTTTPTGTQAMTATEAQQLRKSDPRAYSRLIREGKLQITK